MIEQRTDTATRLKQRLKDKLGKGYLKEVLLSLKEIFALKYQESSDLNKIVLLLSDFNQTDSDVMLGIINWEQAQTPNNRFRQAALHFIDKIEDQAAIAFLLKAAIFKRIVIFCRDADRKPKMDALFANRFYRVVDAARDANEFRNVEHTSKDPISLIIYDNFNKNHQKNATDELSGIIYHPLFKDIPVLIFSPTAIEQIKPGYEYFDRIYFANSPFSIHSRIQEMMLFLEHQTTFKNHE
ncbi:MAG: hypothetical protein AAGJ18_13350 [Bacteroidota bacterium]